MKRAAVATLPRYLAAHALLGACVGALSGAIVAGTDAIGMATLAGTDAIGFVLVPALAGLFAIGAAASALAWLPTQDDDCVAPPQAVALRVPARRAHRINS